VRRYNWHSAGSMGWPFPVLNSTRKLLWFEITKMLVAVFKNYLQVAYDCVDGHCCDLHRERKCADTIGTVPAGSMGRPFPVLNSTRELLWFEISKMLVAVSRTTCRSPTTASTVSAATCIGNESAPILLAQCRFHGLAISSVKQHSEIVMV